MLRRISSCLLYTSAIIIDGKLAAQGTVSELLAQEQADDLEDAFFRLYLAHEKEVQA